jgi:hypothetical protein
MTHQFQGTRPDICTSQQGGFLFIWRLRQYDKTADKVGVAQYTLTIDWRVSWPILQYKHTGKPRNNLNHNRNIAVTLTELTYPNPSLHLINFFGREGNINLT